MTKPLTINELKKRLQEAEEILDALRNHEVDAVIGADQIALLRLKDVEDQLQEQIQISGNRLKEIESIYQNVPVGLCILDTDLKFVRVNNHLSKIHGIPAEEHMGKTMSELLPNLAGKIKPDLRRVIEIDKELVNIELCGEMPDQPGVERCLLEHWLPLHNKQGEVIGINMVIDEITEQKKYEEKLQQLNSTLEERVAERTKIAEERAGKLREMALEMINIEEKERQRLARVLHDGLQQLLIGAKFNTKLIKNRIPEQAEIKDEVDQLNLILDQSIEASRSLSYELSPPILHDHGLIAALRWLKGVPHMQNLDIKIHSRGKISTLSQNLKVFLFQAVRELLLNIIKHAEVDEAEVHVSSDNQNICIEVIDYGKGFDTAKLESNSSSSLGLRNIKEKLSLMNGQLKIISKPESGSHFTLIVPVEIENDIIDPIKTSLKNSDKNSINSETSHSQTVKETGSNIISVLVVDDHQVMRNGLVKLLSEESDIKVAGEASNGLEAVNFVHRFQPKVIIMDITMPEMDGIDATRLIHRDYPDIRVVGLSMHEENEYSVRMKEAGADLLLNKAGPADHLFEAIRGVSN